MRISWFCAVVLIVCSPSAFAKKTNQALYQESFDIAAGGASLTRASAEGVLFANPAVVAFGKKFFRWLGSQTTVISGKESLDLAQSMAKGENSQSNEDTAVFVNKLFDSPIHLGTQSAISFISENIGIAAFVHSEFDLKGSKHDQSGVPSLRARSDNYYGGALSLSHAMTKWLALGVTSKIILKNELDKRYAFADTNAIQQIQDNPQSLQKESQFGQGVSNDFGALFFLQGSHIDFRWAVKVDDLGGTTFTQNQDAFKQTIHSGLGITLHNGVDSLHLSADYRDIQAAYEESVIQRAYLGAKLILRNYIGFAVGAYQGYPSYGVRLDLLLLQLGVTSYTKEMGDYIGEDPRTIYLAYFSLGL